MPGLLALILFHTFNNFLGGVFMSLMDPYGLQLVSVQVWGVLWGVLSLGFIVGGLVVAKRGLGRNPLRTLFLANIAMWTICMFFTVQASIVLLAVGHVCVPVPDPGGRGGGADNPAEGGRAASGRGASLALRRAWSRRRRRSRRF